MRASLPSLRGRAQVFPSSVEVVSMPHQRLGLGPTLKNNINGPFRGRNRTGFQHG